MPRLPTIYDLPRWPTPWLSLSPFFVLQLLDFLHNWSLHSFTWWFVWQLCWKPKLQHANSHPGNRRYSSESGRSGSWSQEQPDSQEVSIAWSSLCFSSRGKGWCVQFAISVWNSVISDLGFKPFLVHDLGIKIPNFVVHVLGFCFLFVLPPCSP